MRELVEADDCLWASNTVSPLSLGKARTNGMEKSKVGHGDSDRVGRAGGSNEGDRTMKLFFVLILICVPYLASAQQNPSFQASPVPANDNLTQAASPAFVRQSLLADLYREGSSSITVNTTQLPLDGIMRGSRVLFTITQHEDKMEFNDQVNCVSNKGATQRGASEGIGTKVCQYVVMRMAPGSGAAYASNIVMLENEGVGNHPAIGIEINHDNRNMDHWEEPNPALASTAVGSALHIAGGGTKRMGSVISVDLNNGNMKTNRGLVFYRGTISKGTIEDWTTSAFGYLMSGTKDIGFDTSIASITSNQALHMAAEHTLSWRNSEGTSDLPLVRKGSDDRLALGNVRFAGDVIIPTATPPASNAACTVGQMSQDASYIYICAATNNWKRALLSSW